MNRNRIRELTSVWFVVAVSLLSAGVWASARFGGTRATLPAANAAREDSGHWRALEVEPVAIASDLWTDPLGSHVRLDETKAARVGVPLSGQVVRVYVELGYDVKQGDPLFSVASPELAALGAEKSRAQLDVAAASAAFERVSALVASNALPARDASDARQRLKQAQLSLQVARAKHDSLSLGTRSAFEFVVRAPRAGRVIEKHVSVGEQLNARGAQTLLTIADLSSVWLVADVLAPDARGIERGTPVRITFPSLAQRVIDGEVETVSATVDPELRAVPVRVRVDNADGALRLNSFAQIQFKLSPPSGSTTIASSALRSNGERSYVYVREQSGEFSRRYVTLAATVADRALLHEGVSLGEQVVVKGIALLDNRIEAQPERGY